MKVKIRGLVFVGFAAAVFAQSAMADANDAKTVTSKLYVDSKVEGVTETGSGDNLTYGDTTIDEDSPNDKAPSALNVYKFVTGQVEDAAITVAGDDTYLTASEDDGTWTVSPKETVATTAAELTGPIANGVAGAFTGTAGNKLVSATAVKALIDGESANGTTTLSDATTGGSTNATVPTSKNVVDYAEKKANKATAIVTSGTGQNNTSQTGGDTAYPTTKAVYDFVTSQVGEAAYQRKLATTETGLYVGQYDANASGTDKSTWKSLEPVAAANSQVTGTDYVTIMDNGSGVYQVNIPAAQIATTAALTGATATNDAGLVTAGSIRQTILQAGSTAGGTIDATTGAVDTTVPTTKNVYEFVTNYAEDNYQPRIDNNDAGEVMIGYNTATTNGGNTEYASDWKVLQDGYDSSTGAGYIDITTTENTHRMQLVLQNVGHAGTDISGATSSQVSAGTDKLASAYAVKEYVTGLTGGLTIPSMPGTCTTAANNGGYCALVYGDTDDTQSGVQAGLMWTVMAPVPSNP